MPTQQKDYAMVAIEAEKRVTAQIIATVYEDATLVMDKLTKKLKSFAKHGEEIETISLPVPLSYQENIAANHGTKTRLDADLKMIEEIKDYVNKYKKGVVDAIGNIYLTADARGAVGIDTFQQMIVAIEKDTKLHSEQIANLFRKHMAIFANQTTYEGVIAHSSMLRADLKAGIEGITRHLEEIALQEDSPAKRLQRT